MMIGSSILSSMPRWKLTQKKRTRDEAFSDDDDDNLSSDSNFFKNNRTGC